MDEGPRSPEKPAEMFNSATDPTLISRHLQKIQERRMYLSQQQYSRQSEERTNVLDQGHLNHSSVLPNEQYNTMAQCPAIGSPSHLGGTSVQDSGSTASSAVASRPETNQETASNEQIDRRHDLLMEVLSQFEKRISAKQIKSFDYAKRQLNSNNGVAFDWGKLPRIGTVHSVQGIMGLEEVQTSPTETSDTNEPNSGQPSSRRRKIKMSELAKLILNGTFDSFLEPDSPEGQSSGNPKTTTGLNNETQSNNEGSIQASGVVRQVSDPRMGSSSQDTALNSVSANDVQSYCGNPQQQTTANQMIPSFNQSPARVETYFSNYASHTSNRNSIESCASQAIHRTIYNTNSVNTNGSGNFALQSNQRTSSNTLYPNCTTGYNTSNGNPVTTGVYVDQLNRRTNYNMNTSNLAVSSSRNYNLQSNQRPSYNTGASNCNQIQRPSYNTSLNHQNISHMVNGQTPGVYGPTPVRTSCPRSLASVPNSAPYIRHNLSSIPLGMSTPSAGRSSDRQYRGIYSSLRDVRSIDRAARTARVEPLSNPTNIVQPSPRATQAITTSTLTNNCSLGHDLTKHDEKSCLDCSLLGTCPIKKAIAAAEKEKEPKDSSDEELELIITKVTTKDAERGPIERIDVDEWVSSRCSSESVSKPVKVKQEPVDKEEVVPNQEEKNCDINNVVNQMRLMAERLLTDDGFLDLGTANRNEENSIDKDLGSDSISIQDLVSDANVVRQQVTISEVVSAQEGRESVTMSRQSTTEGTEGQDGARVCQEAASEETLVRYRTDEDSADKLVAPEVTEKIVGHDCANMDTNVASEVAEEISQENASEDINVDVQTAAEAVNTKSNVQEPIASIAMEIQTLSTATQETLVQNPVDSAANKESVAQDDAAPEGVSLDTQPVSESTEENLQHDHIANDMNADSQSTFGVTGTDQDIPDVTETTGHDNGHLGSLIKKVKSLERCISSLRERAISVSGPDESEYDKGDRNYEKYLSMEGADVTNQENNKTSLNTENIANPYTASRGVSRQPSQMTEMSLHDKEAIENLERQLEENQEKLRYHTGDVCMRKRYLQERLFILRKIERISQKYELMSLGNREAMDKLEKSLELNGEKLKTQKVAWIRKNCLKARLKILKKIERIRRVYGLLPEEPLSLADDVEGRNAQYNLSTIKGIEAEIAREANAVVSVHANNAPHVEVLGQETFGSTRRTAADSLEVPQKNSAAMEQEAQPLSNITDDHNAEEVEESGTPVTGLNNKTGTEEGDSVALEETVPLSVPAFENVVVKSEGTVQESTVRKAFTLEDAINTFVEKPRDRPRETFGDGTSGPPTPDNPSKCASPLQDNYQGNRRKQDHSEKSSLKIAQNSSTERLPQINYDEVVESAPVPENEPKSKQLRETDDLSDEITVTDRGFQTDRNNVHRFPRSFHQNSITEQFGQATDVNAGENSSSNTIARREKRKRGSTEEHVAIKKEKIDSKQDETLQKEQSYNIWDFIKKYSL